MKQIRVIVTVDVTNDQYSQLLNKSVDIDTLIHHMLEDGDDTLSFDLPAVIYQSSQQIS